MQTRQRRRPRGNAARMVMAAVMAAATVAVLPAAAQAVPPQEPGVTLRVFDVQIPLSQICTIKTGQTPNVDKLLPTINWSAVSDFGLDNYFVAHVIGNINIATAGSYTFRLTSDDGSRLSVDNAVVINHDGLHGATPMEGTVTLSTGYHSLRIEHFEREGGQQITLDWRTPGSATFVTVPNSVLSTDAGVVRVTAPGRKECEGSLDSPGDGLPLTSVHPGYTLTNLRPSGFEPQVSGFDWLPDGRLVLCTWGGSLTTAGEVWILGNVTTATSPSQVTRTRVASGLREPMGVKVVDGKIYVAEKHRLTELDDSNGDGVTDVYRTVATWPFGQNFHEFAFGLLYQDGFFYLNLSVSINYGGATTDPQPAPNRGTTIKVDRGTGAVSYLAGGLRTPHGIGWGPENGIFVTDNQGGWLPSSKLLHLKQGRFFNHYTNPAGPFDAAAVTQPVLWMPQNEIANSPSTPVLLPSGVYAGQFVIGDVTYGGLQRAYLEKVNGEYQGALFRMTQGLEAGVSEVSLGPDGALYVGGLHGGGNWGQTGKLAFGLQKLTPNANSAFDILAMRALSNGFELEYTQPVSAATAVNLASRYTVKQWRYTPTPSYGGPKVDEQTLSVTSATLSADAKKVTLVIGGLQPGRVVHVRSPRPFTSAGGQSLWSTEAWYTLNAIPGGAYQAENAALAGGAGVNTNHSGYTGTGFVDGYGAVGASTTFTVTAATTGTHHVSLRYSNGPNPFLGTKTVGLYVNGKRLKQVSLASTGNWDTWAAQVDNVTLNAGSNTVAYRFDSGDTGHLNLDSLTVTAGQTGGGSITGAVGKCLDLDNAGTANGTKVQLWTCNGTSAQRFVRVGETLQVLGKCLDVAGGATANGTKVQLYTCNGSGAQIWQPLPDGTILNPQSGKVMDALAGSSADGTQIHIWQPAGVASQQWALNAGVVNRLHLFDGGDLLSWQSTSGGAASWPVAGGSLESLGGDIQTRQIFGDFKLHVEWLEPSYPPDVTGQARGNSGVYLQNRYEIQVLDSYGDTTLDSSEAGSIYSRKAADSNAATAPNTWQTYDIFFRAARFNASGAKVQDARVTVRWNGVLVHHNVAITSPTGGGAAESAAFLPIRLQDHGDPGPNPRFRNLHIDPL